jgi:lipid-A-disaccharide synthase
MKYYIITGEASGALHASNLMKWLKNFDSEAKFRYWGGDKMEEHGGELVKHYRDLAFMGFVEVALNLRTILGNIRFCKQDILKYKPDALILIDYPGFNLRIAEWAHEQGFRVFYYISPQVWAWKKSRIHKIRKVVNKMFVILPFEKDFYAGYGHEVEFVGHPLLDAISDQPPLKEIETADPGKPVIALLPGSRKQEITRMLPVMLEMVERFPIYQFVIGAAPSLDASFYQSFISTDKTDKVIVSCDGTYNLLRQSHAALVTSGTATLETAIFKVPEVVCYKGNALSFYIARMLVDVPFISLVNLIMEKEIVKELIQKDFNEANLTQETEKLLDPTHRETLLVQYNELSQHLGGPGASKTTAKRIVEIIKV